MTQPVPADDCVLPCAVLLRIRFTRNARLWLTLCALAMSLACGGIDDAGFAPDPAGPSPKGGSTSAPVFEPGASTRELTLRWVPSSSRGVVRYDLLIGESSGSYASVIRIPVNLTARAQDGVLSYAITVRSDVDLFLALRALDSTRASPLSNEIHIAPINSTAQGFAGGGHGGAIAATTSMLSGGGSGGVVAAGLRPSDSSESDAVVATGGAFAGASTGRDAAPVVGDVTAPEADSAADAPLASLEFDGLAEYLANTLPAPVGTGGAFTLSMWLQPVVDAAPRRVLLDTRTERGVDAERVTLALVDGRDLELNVHGADGGIVLSARYALDPVDGAWQHVAVVFAPGHDLEPRVYLDLEACRLLRVEPEGAVFSAPASRHVSIGGAADAPGEGFVGRIGHVAVWDTVLPWIALAEVQGRGHAIDLVQPTGAYANGDDLVHYWRLGDVADVIGFDLGRSAELLDLDDVAGGIAFDDIVLDGPASIVTDLPIP